MQALQQYKGYISVLLLLLLAKFLWEPLWDTKQENWQKYQQSHTALTKTAALLELEQSMLQQQQQMTELLHTAEQRFVTVDNITGYKLDVQKQLESLFATHQLSIGMLSWRDGLVNHGLQTLTLELRFDGQLKHYLELLTILQNSKQFSVFTIDNQQLQIRGQTTDSMGRISGAVTFLLIVKTGDSV